jgi:arabinogalactan oligomer / maltooligosaccharide transport system substrate-binding protein
MKRNLRFAGLLAGVVIVAAACSSGAATTAPSAEAPSAAPSVEASAAPSTAPSAATLSGELTLWESYASGGGELGGFNKIVDGIKAANPDLKINVVEQPFSDIFNKWNTDVAAGGGPDMFIAPNDSLFSQADAGVLADLTSALSGKLDGFTQVAIDGSKVGDKFFMVPESLKAVALWYDKSAVATAPATTDDLLAAVKDGSVKLGLNQNAYHMFGFTGSFGGKLMDDAGKCIADQGGFADAFKYFQDLKAAGAKYYTDGNALKQDFQTGKLNAVVDGPWQTADFKSALSDKLAVAKMPAGPSGSKADPFTGTDGWYINPNSKNIDLAVAFALDFVGTPNEQIFSDEGGHVPAAPGVTINDPLVQGFADAAADGLARPQSSQFNNYWGPFGDAVNQVLDKNADATTTVANACKLMNEANGL